MYYSIKLAFLTYSIMDNDTLPIVFFESFRSAGTCKYLPKKNLPKFNIDPEKLPFHPIGSRIAFQPPLFRGEGATRPTFPPADSDQLRHQCLAALYNVIINEMATDRYLEVCVVLFFCIRNGVEGWGWANDSHRKGHEHKKKFRVFEKSDGEPLVLCPNSQLSMCMLRTISTESSIFFELLAFRRCYL